MRFALCSLGLLLSLAVPPVAAQWFPTSSAFVQGSMNNVVDIAVPVPAGGISAFEGLMIDVTYDGGVFEPLSLTRIPTTNDIYFDFTNSLITAPGPGCATCVVTLMLVGSELTFPEGADISGPGTLFHAQATFNVLPGAPLGPTTVTAAFDNGKGYADSVSFQATIVAVPEPKSWAAMLAGLALFGGVLLRARRRTQVRLA